MSGSTGDRGSDGGGGPVVATVGSAKRLREFVPGALLCGLVLAMALPVILGGRVGTSESGDELHYHVPVIREFATSWPDVDLRRYNSATTPGYHLMMAWVWTASGEPSRPTPRVSMQAGPGGWPPEVRLTESERDAFRAFQRELLPLRLLNLSFGLAAVLVVWVGARRFVGALAAAVLASPFVLSPYITSSSIWLTTDNAAWACVLGALALACGARPGVGSTMGAGALASLAVLMRQIHVWVAGPIGLAGALASPLALLAPRVCRPTTRNARGSWTMLAVALVAAMTPMLIVGGFMWLWGGLTPEAPRIRSIHGGGINPAAPAFGLSVLACYSVFFLPMILRRQGGVRLLGPGVWLALLLGVGFAVIASTSTQAPTFENPPLRGYGWLWAVSGKLPTVGERSLLFLALAPCGAASLVVLWRAARANGRAPQAFTLLVGMLAWLCAQTANPAAWQRYFDPLLLASLAWLTAMGMTGLPVGRSFLDRAARFAPLALATGMLALTARSIIPDLRRNTLPFDGGAPGVTEPSEGADQREMTGARPTE